MLGAFSVPLLLQHLWKSMDDDVQKTANQQTEQNCEGDIPQCKNVHQTTCPNLKIGRYMATTMLPMMPPRNTMMMGSIRLESQATISSTSCS